MLDQIHIGAWAGGEQLDGLLRQFQNSPASISLWTLHLCKRRPISPILLQPRPAPEDPAILRNGRVEISLPFTPLLMHM